MQKLSSPAVAKNRLLFLGRNRENTAIINALIAEDYEVWHADGPIEAADGFDCIVCFDYNAQLPTYVIRDQVAPVVNLHLSYLPYNRGSHPHFWAFLDGTPCGVTIHLVDDGINTGQILYQTYVNIELDETTFTQARGRLAREVEDLFLAKLPAIIAKSYRPRPQRHFGTSHKVADLPKEFRGWDSVISEEVARLDGLLTNDQQRRLQLVDEIEKIRTNNNVNWMDLLRLAIKSSPEEAKQLIRRINTDDNRISSLFAKLGE